MRILKDIDLEALNVSVVCGSRQDLITLGECFNFLLEECEHQSSLGQFLTRLSNSIQLPSEEK